MMGVCRRLMSASLWMDIIGECLNIADCKSLPSWQSIHVCFIFIFLIPLSHQDSRLGFPIIDSLKDRLKTFFVDNFDKTTWREAVRRFNAALSS